MQLIDHLFRPLETDSRIVVVDAQELLAGVEKTDKPGGKWEVVYSALRTWKLLNVGKHLRIVCATSPGPTLRKLGDSLVVGGKYLKGQENPFPDLTRFSFKRDHRLRSSGFEAASLDFNLELIRNDYMREPASNWDDHSLALLDNDTSPPTLVALILWRYTDWNNTARITLGATSKEYRRQGHYTHLYRELRRVVKETYPEAEKISSGHHVNNEASAAMFRSLEERIPMFISYEDTL